MRRNTRSVWLLTTLGILIGAGIFVAPQTCLANSDTERQLKAGEKGTTLESITVEGEDRVQIDFKRPELVLNVDPLSAPGLEWDVVWSLLSPATLDLYSPLPERTREIRSPYRSRFWADTFRRGNVARFRPALEGVESWSLTIADSRGLEVSKFGKNGAPPEILGWNGKTSKGEYALPGRRYSFVLEAADRAGNRRSFVGDGFKLPAYAVESSGGVTLLLSRSDLQGGSKAVPPAPILYAATRINQTPVTAPVTVTVTASDYKSGEAVAKDVVRKIRLLMLGDPSRMSTKVAVEKGVEDPAVVIRVGSAATEPVRAN